MQILCEKSKHSNPDIQTTKSLKISGADLTSKGKDLEPYWNESCKEMSAKLLSLTETGSAGSDLISLNGLQQKTTAKSWFLTTVNSHLKQSLSETYFPSYTFSPVDFTVSGDTVVRSKKIRIYPKPEALEKFRKFLGLSRYWYNQCIEYLKISGTKASLYEARKLQNPDHTPGIPDWALACPQRIREHAIADACDAVKNAKKKFAITKQFQEVSFKSKRQPEQSFGFDKISLQEDSVFKSIFKGVFDASEDIEAALTRAVEGTCIKKDGHRWYVVIPYRTPVLKPENQRQGLVSLDPGVRNFVSFFSATCHGQFGISDFQSIYRLCHSLDRLQSKISKAKARQKQRLRRAATRIRFRIKDLVDDLHKKVAHFLVTRFDTIFVPTFETSEMVTKLQSKTARSMLTYAHYRFKQFLKSKAEEYGCCVIEGSEAWTSKTCSYCGTIQNIGGKKTMHCRNPLCKAKVDRDLNGARGIYLRALVATPSLADRERAFVNSLIVSNH